jgi:sodium/hydrogen antiporter
VELIAADDALVNPADITYIVAGVGLLLAGALPRLARHRAMSAAMGFVAVGLLVGLLPLPVPDVEPIERRLVTERLAELAVIVALMGVGLALDRPFSWRGWRSTWRLLGVAMPLSIAGVAVLGWGLMGLAPATAVLLGAVLAPTDPVLAAEVRVGEPNEGEEEDEVRFGLTSEAGLNDGLAFPFVYLAVAMAGSATFVSWFPRWVAWDVIGKIVIGVVAGLAIGWVLARIAFEAPTASLRYAEASETVLALAATFLAYGVAELAQGYGFLSVFVCALMIRQYERASKYHRTLHEFMGQIERLLTLVLLLLLGAACADGLLEPLTLWGVVVAVLLVLVVRPVAGWVSLHRLRVTAPERGALAFFGVRGIGSIYYLAYAAGREDFQELDELWAVVGLVVLLSVVVHGVLATPWMNRLDAARTPVANARPDDVTSR